MALWRSGVKFAPVWVVCTSLWEPGLIGGVLYIKLGRDIYQREERILSGMNDVVVVV